MQLVSLILIHWIVIYPADSAIHLLTTGAWNVHSKGRFTRYNFFACDVFMIDLQPKSYPVNQSCDSRKSVASKIFTIQPVSYRIIVRT